ncbi:glutathione S-transferase family protein [Nitrogeniibacter mangrovi]|uniref:Glutathione S-transferase family protein n=1 Tax=Nitrogeniibacter mangrovi TaxID=2016596 RepID=A0A6C1B7N1_9RHOO|nr:glutathione S-transferase family protein [Nitrogeniibacter mangrovi]QID19487.1 glutathione S-transferase family protein [Nitrogeniibacter mangrovi]
MPPITFYTNPMSRGQIVRWALHEVGAPYEAHIVEYGEAMHGAEYRRINPLGKVPAIVHEGRVVTECAAICAYLAEIFPEADLLPRPEERADYYRWLFFAAGPVEQANALKAMGVTPTVEQRRMVGCGDPEAVMDALSAKFDTDAYVCGDRFTMADVYVGSHVDWGLAFGLMPKRNALEAYAQRVSRRSAYQAAKAIDNALIAERGQPG